MIKRIMVLCTAVFVFLLCSCKDNTVLNESSYAANNENISSSDREQGSDSEIETSSDYQWEIHSSSNSLRDETSQKPSSSSSKPTINSSGTNTSNISQSTSSQNPPSSSEHTSGQMPVTYPDINSVTEDKYYGYNELKKSGTVSEQKAYLAFVSAIGQYKSQVEFDFPLSSTELKRAYNYYREDYPQHFWRGNSYNYSLQGDNVIKFTLNNVIFGGDIEKIEAASVALSKKISTALSGIKKTMSIVDRERYIHDYLVNNCEYDITYSAPNSHNMYGALMEKKAVCEGYSYAFMYLCRLAGIQCITVEGELIGINGVESHMWNMVELEGKYYHVDVTSDDPIVNGNTKPVLEHTYFNLTDNQISVDHFISQNTITIPKATSEKYNYFKYYGLLFSKNSVENLTKAYIFAAKNGYDYAEIEFTKPSLVDDSVSFVSNNIRTVIDNTNKALGSEKLVVNKTFIYMKQKGFNAISFVLEYK